MKKTLKVVGFLAAVAAGATLPADTLTWSGGDGTWDATSLNWNNGTTAWIPGSTAVFADDGCTVTVSGEVDVGGITFNGNGVTIKGAPGASITNSADVVYFSLNVAEGMTATSSVPLRMEGATFRKYGLGTLVLGATNVFRTAYTNVLSDSGVYEGILRLTKDNTSALGRKDITVKPGATLDVNGCTSGYPVDYVRLPMLHPYGTGYKGMGAVANTGPGLTNRSFGNVNLDSADSLFCGPHRVDVGTISLLNHNLSVSNILDQLCVSTLNFKGTEKVYVEANAMYTVLGGNGGGASGNKGQFVLRGGTLNLWDTKTMPTAVLVEKTSTLNEGNNVASAIGTFSGVLTLQTNVTVNANTKNGQASTVVLAGPLRGSGRIRLNEGHLRITSTDNTWSGQLAVASGQNYRYLEIGARKGTTGTLGNIKSLYGEATSSYFVYERADTYTLANCAVTNGTFLMFDGGTLVFDHCTMTNTVPIYGAAGGVTFRNTRVDAPGRGFCTGTRYTNLDRPLATNTYHVVNIEEGSDLTCSVFEGGNGPNVTNANGSAAGFMTGIVYQTGGRLRTVSAVDEGGGNCGFHFGHWPQARSFYNLSGGSLVIDNGRKLAIAVDGEGTLNQTGGEIFCKTFDLNCRSNGGGHGTYNMEGGELNVGAGGIITGNGTNANEPYSCSLRGGTIRATENTIFKVNATLTSTNGANNVTFDTAGFDLAVSKTLSGTGGLTKAGAGTMTVSVAATYTGATRLLGGTLAFTGAYPGGELEISSATQDGTAAPLLSAHPFAFASGKAKLRVTGADLLDEHTFGPSKTLVESSAAIAAVPELELMASDGTPFTDGKGTWRVFLTDGGRKLKFGPVIGTRILVK